MSKFNFLAGGYYGKLGETVGQRWKNKRIVRAYSKPADPKTNKQEANREQFGIATRATQLAMQMNGGDKLWYSPSNTEFSRRISDARNALKITQNIVQVLPLIPYGTLADIEMSTQVNVTGNTLTYFSTEESDIGGRKLSVIVQATKIGSDKIENFILSGTFAGTSGNWSVSVEIPDGYAVNKNCWTAAVSPATKTEGEKIIYLAAQTILPARDTVYLRIVSAAATTAADGKKTIVVTFNETLESGLPAIKVVANGTYQSQLKERAFSVETNGTFSGNTLTFVVPAFKDSLGNPARFSSASKMEIGSFDVDGNEKIYVFEQQEITTITDDKATVAFPLVYSVTSWGKSGNVFSAKLNITDTIDSATNGAVSFPYFAIWKKDASKATNIAAAYNTTTNAIDITMSDEQQHYTGNRDVKITSAIGLKKDGLSYEIPQNATIEQTNVVTTEYDVDIDITAASGVRNSASSYTITFETDVAKDVSANLAVNVYGDMVLQAEWDSLNVDTTGTLANGKITATVTPNKDSLGQYAQFGNDDDINIIVKAQKIGMTNIERIDDGAALRNMPTETQVYAWKDVIIEDDRAYWQFPTGDFYIPVNYNTDWHRYDVNANEFSEGKAQLEIDKATSRVYVGGKNVPLSRFAFAGGKWRINFDYNTSFVEKNITYTVQKKWLEITGLPSTAENEDFAYITNPSSIIGTEAVVTIDGTKIDYNRDRNWDVSVVWNPPDNGYVQFINDDERISIEHDNEDGVLDITQENLEDYEGAIVGDFRLDITPILSQFKGVEEVNIEMFDTTLTFVVSFRDIGEAEIRVRVPNLY